MDTLFGMPIIESEAMGDSMALVEFGDFGAYIEKFVITGEMLEAAMAAGIDVKSWLEAVIKRSLHEKAEADWAQMEAELLKGSGAGHPKGILG